MLHCSQIIWLDDLNLDKCACESTSPEKLWKADHEYIETENTIKFSCLVSNKCYKFCRNIITHPGLTIVLEEPARESL